jgi:anti-sigma B factor antagonist
MSDDEPWLDIASADSDGATVLTVAGEIDLTNAEILQEAVDGTSTPAVVLDLSHVAYLDSSGIRAIDRSRRRLLSEDRSLVIVSPPDTPSSWTFRVAGFGSGLVVASVEAALAAAARRPGDSS